MNIVAFCDDILDSAALTWIKQRKVIYIPKAGKDPLLPSSYRPLSLLEVLYKIPAKILTDRTGQTGNFAFHKLCGPVRVCTGEGGPIQHFNGGSCNTGCGKYGE